MVAMGKHKNPRKPEDLAVRLCRYSENGPNGCTNWTMCTNKDGYGIMGTGSRLDGTNRSVVTHRVSAAVWLGFSLKSPFKVLHKCDNPACINPDHLFIGTQADNVADREAKGRTAKGEMSRSNFSPSDVLEIRRAYANGTSIKELANRYSVHWNTIDKIVLRQRWGHVPEDPENTSEMAKKNKKLSREEWKREWFSKLSKIAHSSMTPEQRSARSKKSGKAGAKARWGKKGAEIGKPPERAA